MYVCECVRVRACVHVRVCVYVYHGAHVVDAFYIREGTLGQA